MARTDRLEYTSATASATAAEMASDGEQPSVADPLRWQAGYCRLLGSELYASLLERSADDVERSGPTAAVLDGHEHDRTESMIALRLMGAVHKLVLRGDAPELEPFYPSVGGRADAGEAWPVFRGLLAERGELVRKEIEAPVQTNEVGRSAALLVGFLTVAQRTGLPLRMLEVGASAGLNLLFDRYFYSTGEESFGPRESPVRFIDVYDGRPPFEVGLEVVERRGCDANPLDPCSEDDRRTLTAYVWADQEERFRALRGALEIACREGRGVERADAPSWIEQRLAEEGSGTARVVYHSLVMQYLAKDARARFQQAVERAGEKATPDAPLAWLRMEPGGAEADVRLTLWPGGEDEQIATAGYHGRPVRTVPR
jgi:hypothetical protein